MMISTQIKILVVEDEHTARKGLCKLIESMGEKYQIVGEASDGKKALDLILSLKPDIIFTDIKMPYMDGIALIKAVSNLDIKVNFVITSAYEEFDFAKQAIALGVFDYLVKPLTYTEVEDILLRLETNMHGLNGRDITKGKLYEDYPNAHPMIKKALNIIEDGYALNINQEELAERLGMTREYFSYLFRKEIGQTFSKFLRAYRISIATKMLLTNEIDKKEIPYHVGFSDEKYFFKVFKEITGLTVTEFLRKNI
ncbi:MAG: response regulator [Anaerolineaceae bacterium]|nr:MAG: response regulator [Anaerolineaceae bacterium]